ncbi:MAG: TonB family protein [Myxococcales bacterium]|nr:MAG: TonB family protein [Myxococcales bacterium]
MRRPRWTCIGWKLLLATALTGAAVAEPTPEGEAQAALPPVSAHPPLVSPMPAGIAELLPPGVRPAGSPSDWVPATDAAAGDGSDAPGWLVERVERATPSGDARERIQVEYTIDRELEVSVREVLRRGGVQLGSVVLMDPVSGAVLAYVSTDPIAFPVTRTYPTASLAKVVTAAAVLRRAPAAAGRDCRYLGSPYTLGPAELVAPSRGGSVDPFWRALANSNNQCFARLAVGDVGAEAMLSEMASVGLLEAPAPGHPAGLFAPVRDALDLGRLGSGLAGSFISPLAAVRLAAVLAHGELVRPHWIAHVQDAEGRSLALPAPEAPQRVWLPELADQLRELLVGVTTQGTARSAFLDARGAPLLGPVRVAGKTGTLSGENPAGVYQWFIGIAPADAPRLAISALVVDGGRGRHSASQIAAEVLHEIFCDSEVCAPERLEARMAAWVQARPDPAPAAEAPLEDGPVDAAELDEMLRLVAGGEVDFPRRLRRNRVRGQIVFELELNRAGEVVALRVDSSNLPAFEKFVSQQVRSWKFTPPTRDGRPVEARARLPISITLN